MEKIMEQILMWLGCICVLAGIIAGFVVYDKDVAEAAKTSEEISDELYDNSYAQAEYKTNSALANSMKTSVFFVVLSGIFSGAILFSIAVIIRILNDSKEQARETKDYVRLIKARTGAAE